MAVAINTPTGNTHTYAAGSVLTINGTLNLGSATFGAPVSVAQGGTGRITALARFRARGSVTQVFTSGVAAKAEVNTEIEDTGGYFDTTNYRWGPLPAGKYLIGCNVVSANAPWTLVVNKNASGDIRLSYEQNTGAPNGCAIVESDGNDYFEFWLTNQSGGNADLYIADAQTLFWGQELM